MEGQSQGEVWPGSSSLISCQHCPITSDVRSQIAGAAALRGRSSLVLFMLSACSFFLQASALLLQRSAVLEPEVLNWAPSGGWGLWLGGPGISWSYRLLWAPAAVNARNGCPFLVAMLCGAWACPGLRSCARSSEMAAFALVESCPVGREDQSGAWHGLGCMHGWSQHQSELRITPDLPPCDQWWAPLFSSDALPDPSWLCSSRPSVLLSCGSLCPSVELHSGASGAGGGAWHGLGPALGSHGSSLLLLPCFGSKQVCVYFVVSGV